MFIYTFIFLIFVPLLTHKFNLPQFYTYISLISVTYFSLVLPNFSSSIVRFKFLTVDSVSLLLVYITVLVILTSFYRHNFLLLDVREALLTFLILTAASFLVFTAGNILLLYISFEASLIPISYLILKWGAYPDRGYSAILMLLFTRVFTFPLILLILVYYSCSSSTLFYLASIDLVAIPFLFICWILLSFRVKLPVYGLHYWLPIAHVEAPTFGSIILAGLLLKIGGCGLIRFRFLFTTSFTLSMSWLLSYLLISIVVVSFICCRQSDIKRLVAYSSVLHITVVLLIILVNNSLSLTTSLILMTFHGLSSPLLFYFVGNIYSLYKTRLLISLRGLLLLSPLLALMSLLNFILNIPVPPFPAFLSEVLVFVSSSYVTQLVLTCAFLIILLVLIYNLSWFVPLTLSSFSRLTPTFNLGLSCYLYHIVYVSISFGLLLFIELFFTA